MSKEFLDKLLKEEIAILQKNNKFVRDTSDRKAHKFTISVSNVREEIYNQLRGKRIASSNVLNSQEMYEQIDKAARSIVTSSYKYMDRYRKEKAGNIQNFRKLAGGDGYSLIVLEPGKRFRKKEGKTTVTPITVFETIKESYKQSKDRAVKNLNAFLSKVPEQTGTISQSDFLDLDHKKGSVISRQEVNQSKARIGDKSSSYKRAGEAPITKDDLKTLGITVFVSKKDTLAQSTVEVGLRAANLNRGLDKQAQTDFKNEYIAVLEKAVRKLEKSKSFANRPGSDTRTQIEKKKIIKAFNDSVKSGKNVKKKSVDTKLKLSKGKPVSKKVSPKVKKGRNESVPVGDVKVRRARAPKSSANSDITLAALLNQKLPATVSKNMGLPGLQYRSGRFANSVRITDITRTTKGFPSIGYTYRRNPYQTFEPGYKQGSTEKDPRKLIDKSIREIAAELLIGRFYTRRV